MAFENIVLFDTTIPAKRKASKMDAVAKQPKQDHENNNFPLLPEIWMMVFDCFDGVSMSTPPSDVCSCLNQNLEGSPEPLDEASSKALRNLHASCKTFEAMIKPRLFKELKLGSNQLSLHREMLRIREFTASRYVRYLDICIRDAWSRRIDLLQLLVEKFLELDVKIEELFVSVFVESQCLSSYQRPGVERRQLLTLIAMLKSKHVKFVCLRGAYFQDISQAQFELPALTCLYLHRAPSESENSVCYPSDMLHLSVRFDLILHKASLNRLRDLTTLNIELMVSFPRTLPMVLTCVGRNLKHLIFTTVSCDAKVARRQVPLVLYMYHLPELQYLWLKHLGPQVGPSRMPSTECWNSPAFKWDLRFHSRQVLDQWMRSHFSAQALAHLDKDSNLADYRYELGNSDGSDLLVNLLNKIPSLHSVPVTA